METDRDGDGGGCERQDGADVALACGDRERLRVRDVRFRDAEAGVGVQSVEAVVCSFRGGLAVAADRDVVQQPRRGLDCGRDAGLDERVGEGAGVVRKGADVGVRARPACEVVARGEDASGRVLARVLERASGDGEVGL